MAAKSRATTTYNSSGADAIALLTADHEAVRAMFRQFESLRRRSDESSDDTTDEIKFELAQRICTALTIHATIEDEIFYPAVRGIITDPDRMDEADVQHASARALIAELQCAAPGGDHFDARVAVLGDLVDHHVREEEARMFETAKRGIDTAGVGAVLAARKAQLEDDLCIDGITLPASNMAGGSRLAGFRR